MINPMEVIEDKAVFTVHQLNNAARSLLENTFQHVWVKGELSNVATPRSGHIYFTLKDAHAQVRCALFKGSNRKLNFIPIDGKEVLIRANVSIYEERGDYQLIVSHMEKGGLGQLQQAFESLIEWLSHVPIHRQIWESYFRPRSLEKWTTELLSEMANSAVIRIENDIVFNDQ